MHEFYPMDVITDNGQYRFKIRNIDHNNIKSSYHYIIV